MSNYQSHKYSMVMDDGSYIALTFSTDVYGNKYVNLVDKNDKILYTTKFDWSAGQYTYSIVYDGTIGLMIK